VTFKDLRKIIEESQKLDDDKIAAMRLRLWPIKNGNGNNGHNKNNVWGLGWKGRPIVSSEEWKRLAEYTEFSDVFNDENVITPEERWSWKTNLNDSMGIWDKIDSRLRKEINPKALQYFPHDLFSVVFYRSYSCPKAPDLYKEWVSDYRELLIARGYETLIPGFSYGS
jgi:hypothetical protein